MPVLAVNATAVTVPFTPSEVNVPTLVTLGCAAVVSVPVNRVEVNAPVAASNEIFALAPNARFPVALLFANTGKNVPVV